jgi:hypothetical protein
VQAFAILSREVRGVPLRHELLALGGGEERQLREPPARAGRQTEEERAEVPLQAGQGGAVEEIGLIDQTPFEAGRGLPHPDAEVELGRPCIDLREGEVDAGRRGPVAARPQVGEHDLEERRELQAALRLHLVHHPLEGDLGVCVRREHGVAHPMEDLPPRGIAVQAGPQHQGVDQEPDHALGLRTKPARHR